MEPFNKHVHLERKPQLGETKPQMTHVEGEYEGITMVKKLDPRPARMAEAEEPLTRIMTWLSGL